MRTLAFELRKIMTGSTPRRRAEGGASAARRDEEALAEKDASHESKNVDFLAKKRRYLLTPSTLSLVARRHRREKSRRNHRLGDRGASSGLGLGLDVSTNVYV